MQLHTIRRVFPFADDFSLVVTNPDHSPHSSSFFYWNGNLPESLEGRRALISECEGRIFLYQAMNVINGDIYRTKVSRIKANKNYNRHSGEVSDSLRSMQSPLETKTKKS